MEWLAPWRPVTEDEARGLERECAAEIGKNHPLFQIPLAAVARSDASDDVLFELRDGSGRVSAVHLTWTRHPEPAPWPESEIYDSIHDFAERRMRSDHAEHLGA